MHNYTSKLTKAVLSLLGVIALAACQTIPEQTGFNAEQIALLTDKGFEEVGENYELGLANRVLFGFDSSDLKDEQLAEIAGLVRELVAVKIGGATIEGHTDSKGASDYNLRLSEQRAEAVKVAFVAGGMDGVKVRTIGYGETDPIEDNATEEGRAENRRVVIVVSPADVIPY